MGMANINNQVPQCSKLEENLNSAVLEFASSRIAAVQYAIRSYYDFLSERAFLEEPNILKLRSRRVRSDDDHSKIIGTRQP